MSNVGLPYLPVRWHVYDRTELFAGFDLDESNSFAGTLDFTIYQHFVMEGRAMPKNPYMGMMQALHDNAITQALSGIIGARRVAAIMGGHKMPRDASSYRDVALLARRLTRAGILVCTGGGPGAMEASHLGATLAHAPDADLDAAIAKLATVPIVPPTATVVAPDGAIDWGLVHQAHQWIAPAFEIIRSIASPADSVAIPTWHYGHEPTTPLANHIAKYFQNSIREDGLLALAKQGVVFAAGKAGTTQEIFQDAAQNYYRSFGHFSPMVLFGIEEWTKGLPVVPVLERLFGPEDFASFVLLTDSVDEAAGFIERFEP